MEGRLISHGCGLRGLDSLRTELGLFNNAAEVIRTRQGRGSERCDHIAAKHLLDLTEALR